MDPPVGRVRFAPVKSAWLWTMILTGVVGAVVATPRTLAAAAALHVITLCVGHSVGLHRGIIHRSYRASRVVFGVLADLAVLTGLGGPLTESGTNVWVLGVLSFGEGFHNHHQAFPRSARMGRAPSRTRSRLIGGSCDVCAGSDA